MSDPLDLLAGYVPRRRMCTVSKASSYYECVKDARGILTQLVKESLAEASGVKHPRMMWTHTTYHHTPRVTYLYRVRLVGWPADIPFDSPSQHSSLRVLGVLVAGFRTRAIRFVKMCDAEFWALAKREHTGSFPEAKARRVDIGRRPVRPASTRSKRKMLSKKTVKTSRVTTGKED